VNVLGLIVAGILAALVYMIHCALFPFAACLRCGGGGRRRSGSGRSWRRCSKCKGTGERVRVGRRIWDWYKGDRR
jgi:hypothetical protein